MSAAVNMAQQLEAYIESDLIEDEYFNFSVRVHASMMANQLKMAFSYVAGPYYQLRSGQFQNGMQKESGQWTVFPRHLLNPLMLKKVSPV